MAEADELTRTIARHLEVDHQYSIRVEAWDTERIAGLRSAGRKAGRLLGWKIQTLQLEPDDENRVLVFVVVREWPSQEERERLGERAALLMEQLPAPPCQAERPVSDPGEDA